MSDPLFTHSLGNLDIMMGMSYHFIVTLFPYLRVSLNSFIVLAIHITVSGVFTSFFTQVVLYMYYLSFIDLLVCLFIFKIEFLRVAL